jgi:hypothetical protein
MIIQFSRHAKRRAKLYNIPESTIEQILNGLALPEGEHEITREIKGFQYPIKIVVSVKDAILIVVTNYPLKKGRKK